MSRTFGALVKASDVDRMHEVPYSPLAMKVFISFALYGAQDVLIEYLNPVFQPLLGNTTSLSLALQGEFS
jgi:hypothetical protein